jgi:hemerythrin
MMDQGEWFAWSRTLSPAIRARDEAHRKLMEIVNCDDCQLPEYDPCDKHKERRPC